MRSVHLHGALEELGGPYELDVKDPAEAIRALSTQLDGFSDILDGGEWQVVTEKGPVDEQQLTLGLGSRKEIHIMPAISGAGGGSTGKILTGAALIGASFFIPAAGVAGLSTLSAGTIATMGASLALNGVSAALSARNTPDYEQKTPVDQKPSFLFNGPVNNAAQGLPVPLVLGKIKTGSIVISSDLVAEKI